MENHPPSLHPQASVLRPPLDPQTMATKRGAEDLDGKIAANKINAIKMILNSSKYTLPMKSDPNNFVMHMHRIYTTLRIYDMHTLLPLIPSQFDYAFNLSNPQKATLFDCIFMSLGDDVQATLPTSPGHNPDGQWLLRLLWTTNAPGVNVASLSQQNMRAYNDHRNTSGDPFAYILELNRLYASLGHDDKPTAPNFLQTVREQLASDPNARAVIRELSRDGTPQPDKLLAALMEELKPISASGQADSGPTLSAFATSRAPQQPRTNLPHDFISTLSERDKDGKCFFCHYGEHDWSKCRKWKDRLAYPRSSQDRAPQSDRSSRGDISSRPTNRSSSSRPTSVQDQGRLATSTGEPRSSQRGAPRKAYTTAAEHVGTPPSEGDLYSDDLYSGDDQDQQPYTARQILVQRSYNAYSARQIVKQAPVQPSSLGHSAIHTALSTVNITSVEDRRITVSPDTQANVTCFFDQYLAVPGTLSPTRAEVQGIGSSKAQATHTGTIRFTAQTSEGTSVTLTIPNAVLIPDDSKRDTVLLEQDLLVRQGHHEIRHNDNGYCIHLRDNAGKIVCARKDSLPYFEATVPTQHRAPPAPVRQTAYVTITNLGLNDAPRTEEEALSIHQRLGCMAHSPLQRLLHCKFPRGWLERCETCPTVKIRKRPVSSIGTNSRDAYPGTIFYTDLSGKISPASFGGKQYVSLYAEKQTELLYIYFLASKNDNADTIPKLIADARRDGWNVGPGSNVGTVHSDNGAGEYRSPKYIAALVAHNLTSSNAPPHVPEKRIVEFHWRPVMLAATCLLNTVPGTAPPALWPPAVSYSGLIRDHTSRYEDNTSPFQRAEAILGHPVARSQLEIIGFGTRAFLVKIGSGIGSFDDRGEECVFVGYAYNSLAPILYKPRTNTFVEAFHVKLTTRLTTLFVSDPNQDKMLLAARVHRAAVFQEDERTLAGQDIQRRRRVASPSPEPVPESTRSKAPAAGGPTPVNIDATFKATPNVDRAAATTEEDKRTDDMQQCITMVANRQPRMDAKFRAYLQITCCNSCGTCTFVR